MTDIQLIYASQPFGFDDAILNGILLDARVRNNRDGITGALVCRQDIYLQLLEGPEALVQSAYERILRDDRHTNIRQLICQPIETRLFGAWDMLHDPAQSWHWTAQQIADGSLDRASEADVMRIFTDLAVRAKAGTFD